MMKAVFTALGVIVFIGTMAVAKTGKFHTPAHTGNSQQSYAQWHRAPSIQSEDDRGPGATGG
jgi:hypothetical protein